MFTHRSPHGIPGIIFYHPMTAKMSHQLDAIQDGVERARSLGVTKKDLNDPLFIQHFPFGGVLLVIRNGRKVKAGMYPKSLPFKLAWESIHNYQDQ